MNSVNSMNTSKQYKYSLDSSSRKFNCPSCNQKRFVRFKDSEGSYLDDIYGRCDRESSCGYFLRPEAQTIIPVVKKEKPIKIDFLPLDLVKRSMDKKYYKENNLFKYLSILFSEKVAEDIFLEYLIGSSKYWKGSTCFWQIDEKENVHQGKVILFDPYSGKRIKEPGTTVLKWDAALKTHNPEQITRSCTMFVGKKILGAKANLEQCFFGQHLLAEYPKKKVCIVESEKTCFIAAINFPEFIWLSTGAAIGGCKWREYSVYRVLRNRDVTFFPDYGYADKKTNKTCYDEWKERVKRISEAITGNFKVSDLLERKLADQERNDQDLADILISRDKDFWALTEDNYPTFWDYDYRHVKIA